MFGIMRVIITFMCHLLLFLALRNPEDSYIFFVYCIFCLCIFICPKNSDHIMPYRLPSVIVSDRAKIFLWSY